MNNEKIIERQKHSLNFIEQLQNQMEICTKLLSKGVYPLEDLHSCINAVKTFENLLWAKLKDDDEYKKAGQEFKKITEPIRQAREQFKAIMIFIDKKNLMPIGEQDE